jgi:hypothetical protein
VVVLPGLSDVGASGFEHLSGVGTTGFEPLFHLANAVLEELVCERVIGENERKRMVLGAYPRRRAQLLEPFSENGQFQSLSVEHCDFFDLPDAAWDDYQRDGNVETLVSLHAAFFRAIFRSLPGFGDQRCRQAASLRGQLGTKTKATPVGTTHPISLIRPDHGPRKTSKTCRYDRGRGQTHLAAWNYEFQQCEGTEETCRTNGRRPTR